MEHATTSPVTVGGCDLPVPSRCVVRGMDLGRKLAAALGIEGKPWQKIVIVADVKDVARVYVKGLFYTDSVDGIVQAVKDVVVSDEGEVTIVDHPGV